VEESSEEAPRFPSSPFPFGTEMATPLKPTEAASCSPLHPLRSLRGPIKGIKTSPMPRCNSFSPRLKRLFDELHCRHSLLFTNGLSPSLRRPVKSSVSSVQPSSSSRTSLDEHVRHTSPHRRKVIAATFTPLSPATSRRSPAVCYPW
jgi:hypothetical protein